MTVRSNPPPVPSKTARDLAALERLIDAKKPKKVTVEELSSTNLLLEEEELGDEDLLVEAEEEIEIEVSDTRTDTAAYVPEPAVDAVAMADTVAAPVTPRLAPEPPPPSVPQDLAQTVRGIPSPLPPAAMPSASAVLEPAIAEPIIREAPIPEAPKTSPVPLAAVAAVAPIAKTLLSATHEPVSAPAPAPVAVAVAVATADADDAAELAEDRRNVTQPFRRPSSIAPVAIDLTPPPVATPVTRTPVRVPSHAPAPVAARPITDRTAPMQRLTARDASTVLTRIPPPKNDFVPWIVAAAVAGVFLVGSAIAAAYVSSSSSSSSSSAASSSSDESEPRNVEVTGAHSAVTDPVESTPSIGAHGQKYVAPAPTFTSNEPVSVDALPTVAAPAAAPSPHHHSHAVAPPSVAANPTPSTPSPAPSPAAPAPVTTSSPAAVAAPAPAPRPAATTGVVHVPPPLVVIVVDGQHRRVVDGNVVVTCGVHKIRAGIHETQVVSVPCGGAVSL